jgi:predicted ATPase
MHHVPALRLAGYKSIEQIDLDLRPFNILIGANGAGKSNLLSWFRFLNSITTERLQLHVADAGEADAVLHHGVRRTQRLTCDVRFSSDDGSNTYALGLQSTATGKLMFEYERLLYSKKGRENPLVVDMGAGHLESNLVRTLRSGGGTDGKTAKFIKWNLDRFRYYHFHDTSKTAPIKQPSYLDGERFLTHDAGNLAAFLYRISQVSLAALEAIEETIRMVAPFFDRFVLEPSATSTTVKLRWRERGAESIFGPHQLSDGTLRFMCLATLLLQPNDEAFLPPRLIVLDEPELGLHPYAISVLGGLLRQATSWSQVLVATQSPLLLDAVVEEPAQIEDVLVAEHEKGKSTFHRYTAEQMNDWLANYSPGQLWLKGVLKGSPLT